MAEYSFLAWRSGTHLDLKIDVVYAKLVTRGFRAMKMDDEQRARFVRAISRYSSLSARQGPPRATTDRRVQAPGVDIVCRQWACTDKGVTLI